MRDVIDLIYMFIIINSCIVLIILEIYIFKKNIEVSKEMKEIEQIAKKRDKK